MSLGKCQTTLRCCEAALLCAAGSFHAFLDGEATRLRFLLLGVDRVASLELSSLRESRPLRAPGVLLRSVTARVIQREPRGRKYPKARGAVWVSVPDASRPEHGITMGYRAA